MNIQENINVLFEKFEAFINSQTIIGQEIKVGDVTIIPLASISFGLGAGAGGESADSNGGGSGICAKATPQALLVVNGSDVNLIPIRKGSSFESLLDSVPALIDKIKEMKPESETEDE
ncbi:GerW family sporulation protein [Acidaminobacter sp. JC074]|uniref:GerW family sporulation protein n=1 Tax=Acidaminobacter sp. JC074 TaxID=2530199 RepID=UPI001F0D3222|nr:spore germination protein GerW family protein [Acidaminobacter sp. JC074]